MPALRLEHFLSDLCKELLPKCEDAPVEVPLLCFKYHYHSVMSLKVETKTKVDIEDKKKQLRLLVGNSYRFI